MLESAISCLSVIITKVTRHYKYAVQMLGTCFGMANFGEKGKHIEY